MNSPIAYPTKRLLANPEVLVAIANHFKLDEDGFATAFYTLQEIQLEDDDGDFSFKDDITYVLPDFKDPHNITIQSMGTGIYVTIKLDEEIDERTLKKIARINKFIQDCLKKAESLSVTDKVEFSKSLKEDMIVLDPPPTPKNNFLSSESSNTIEGGFYFLSDPTAYKYVINILDVDHKKVDTKIEQTDEKIYT